MFTKSTDTTSGQLMKGVIMRPLAFAYNYPYEQTGILISGKLNFRIEHKLYAAEAGDSWSIPINIEHEVEVVEDSIVLEVFSPLRPDYLPAKKRIK